MAEDADSRTEAPTEKRLRESLERGEGPVSREAPTLAALAAALVVGAFALKPAVSSLAGALADFLRGCDQWRFERAEDAKAVIGGLTSASATFLLTVVGPLSIAGVVASAFPNAPRFVAARIAPDLSRLSPRQGLRRLLSLKRLVEFAKAALKLAIVFAAAAIVGSAERVDWAILPFGDPQFVPGKAVATVLRLVAAAAAGTTVVVAADLAWAQFSWRRDQKMTRHELQEEIRQAEGDRLIKSRLRSLRLDRSRRRMLAAVPRATMVVANPTHYAVALRYVRGESAAPLVVAKGQDLIALKIREIAERHDIPIVEDKPLARSLYGAVEIDQPIPAEFYRAVAQIVIGLRDAGRGKPAARRMNA